MEWEKRIELNPAVLVGKPVVRGTRVAVELVVDLLADGWSEQEISDGYGVTHEDVQACLRYAGERLRSERVYPLKA